MKRILSRCLIGFFILCMVAVYGYSHYSSKNPSEILTTLYGQSKLTASDVLDYPLTIRMMDVGNADCTLIQCDDVSILVDCGDYTNAARLTSTIRRICGGQLDYLIATHLHEDHVGALPALLEDISVKTLVFPRNIPGLSDYLQTAGIASRGITVQLADVGILVKGAQWALKVLQTGQAENANENDSLIFQLRYGTNTFLFMGDAEKNEEEALLENAGDIQSDWLKVGHHGSNTSGTEAFLAAVSPKIAAISCNGSADARVIKRLEQLSCSVYRTDTDGTLLFGSDGTDIFSVATKYK